MKTRLRRTLRGKCECADAGCKACKGQCANLGKRTLFRVDMVDATGTLFCPDCADDAMESGLFAEHRNSYS